MGRVGWLAESVVGLQLQSRGCCSGSQSHRIRRSATVTRARLDGTAAGGPRPAPLLRDPPRSSTMASTNTNLQVPRPSSASLKSRAGGGAGRMGAGSGERQRPCPGPRQAGPRRPSCGEGALPERAGLAGSRASPSVWGTLDLMVTLKDKPADLSNQEELQFLYQEERKCIIMAKHYS